MRTRLPATAPSPPGPMRIASTNLRPHDPEPNLAESSPGAEGACDCDTLGEL